jgi:hypothetical protein
MLGWGSVMNKLLVTTAVSAILVGSTHAQRPELLVTMGQLSITGGIAEQAIAVKNNSRKPIRLLWIECSFLDANGDLLSDGLASITNLRPGDIGYVSPKTPHGEGATRAVCRVSWVRH